MHAGGLRHACTVLCGEGYASTRLSQALSQWGLMGSRLAANVGRRRALLDPTLVWTAAGAGYRGRNVLVEQVLTS